MKKKNKGIIIYILLSIMLNSCYFERTENKLASVLTDGGVKHWDLAKNDWYYPSYGKSFNVDGSFKDFLYSKSDRKCLYEGPSDVVIPSTWSIEGDSLIIIGNGRFKAKIITKDLLILSSESNQKLNIILVKSEEQSDNILICNEAAK